MKTILIDKNSAIPRYYQFKELIKKQIEQGILKPGDKLSSEPKLIQKYKISSSTIRKAFLELSNEGLIRRENGKGTFVTSNISFKKFTRCRKKIGFLNYLQPNETEYEYATSTFVIFDIQKGILRESFKRGIKLDIFNIFIINNKRFPANLEELIKDCDGVIFPHIDEYLFDKKILKGKPYIIVNHPKKEKNLNHIYVDYENVGFIATEHLIKIGRKKIGYIGSNKRDIWSMLKEKGFRKALSKNLIPLKEEWIVKCRDNKKSDGYESTLKLIEMKDRPDAIYVDTDWKALGVCEAIKDKKLKIPYDIAVIGTDDIEPSAMASPSLSTIRIKREEQGEKAVEILNGIISGKLKRLIQYEIKTELIIRNSTLPLEMNR
jgi:DNA-binding LacI/PurR family transcriptional regulator